MKVHSGSGHNAPLAEINVVPFVDIVLVLLIIFMITAPFIQQGMPIELPKAQSPEIKANQEDLTVTIDRAGKIFLSDTKQTLTLAELQAKLAAIYQQKQEKALLIKADQRLQYGEVVQVMATALKAGVVRIGMITQPDGKME